MGLRASIILLVIILIIGALLSMWAMSWVFSADPPERQLELRNGTTGGQKHRGGEAMTAGKSIVNKSYQSETNTDCGGTKTFSFLTHAPQGLTYWGKYDRL
jgi:hypothetical protein